jgi:hypothetical protein
MLLKKPVLSVPNCCAARAIASLANYWGYPQGFSYGQESVKRDLKEWNIPKDLAMDRSAWRLTINVIEP